MYLNNKYTNWYFSIISSAKLRKIPDEYTEKHHIIPKSLGGTNDKDNLVYLTAKEHFVVHHLLIKMLDDTKKHKMINAYWRMVTSNKIKVTSKQYEISKKLLAAYQSKLQKKVKKEQWNNPDSIYNSKHYKESTSKAIKSLWDDPNSIYNTEEYRKNKSDATKKVFLREGQKENHSKIMKEICNTSEMKEKFSVIQKEIQNRPERLELQSKAIKSLWDDPNSIYNTEEYRKNKSISQKEIQNRPEIKEKIFEKNAKNYIVTNPQGQTFEIKGLSKFCKENKLSAGNMCWLANGKLKYYKGWSCEKVD